MSDWIDTTEVNVYDGAVDIDMEFDRCSAYECCGQCERKSLHLTADEAIEMANSLLEAAAHVRANPNENLHEEDIRKLLGLKPKWDKS